MHTDEDIVTALASMKTRLNDTGVLVLTQGTTHFTLNMPSIEVVINQIDLSRIFLEKHDSEFQTIHVLDLYHSKERTESHLYDIVYKVILNEDYKKLLLKAGFKDIKIYGDYKGTVYAQNSKRLIVVAR